jgi:MFS family permease
VRPSSRYRWFVLVIFFVAMLTQQSDRLLIGTLTPAIMAAFHINMAQMGAVTTGALVVGTLSFPVWGYLYDRYGRAKLLALASLIWGVTTWLSAVAPTYTSFLVARSTTGIDDSSAPGIYSLMSDYFGPSVRGKIFGLLEAALPIGYLVGMALALTFSGALGWRGVYFITGSLGIGIAFVIFFAVREPVRGATEPELQGVDQVVTHRFEWSVAKALFRKRTLRLLYLQGFFGAFPWNVIAFWFFTYLVNERAYSGIALFLTAASAVIAMAIGYPLGGFLGDLLFRRTPRGRALVAMAGVFIGMVLLPITLSVPVARRLTFLVMLPATALFIPFAAPNVISTVHDVSLPEVRSTAVAIQYFVESAGAALAPTIAGLIADRSSLQWAFVLIGVSTWLICGIIYAFVALVVPSDIAAIRAELRERARR